MRVCVFVGGLAWQCCMAHDLRQSVTELAVERSELGFYMQGCLLTYPLCATAAPSCNKKLFRMWTLLNWQDNCSGCNPHSEGKCKLHVGMSPL
jgi:hypothetical protein